METILKTENMTKKFKGLTAVNQLNLNINHNEIHGLIGPNGSGKSTTINLITGFLHQTEGRIHFNRSPVESLSSHKRASLGLVRTFQEPSVFGKLTVAQNMLVSFYHSRNKEKRTPNEEIEEALQSVGLLSKKDLIAGDLSYGEQKLLDLAKAILIKPKMILLDEPAAGISGNEKKKLINIIKMFKKQGVTVLLCEHDVPMVMSLSDRITVLNFGSKITDGSPNEIRKNQQVIDAYLGGSA